MDGYNVLEQYNALFDAIRESVLEEKLAHCGSITNNDSENPSSYTCISPYDLTLDDFKQYLTAKEEGEYTKQINYLSIIGTSLSKLKDDIIDPITGKNTGTNSLSSINSFTTFNVSQDYDDSDDRVTRDDAKLMRRLVKNKQRSVITIAVFMVLPVAIIVAMVIKYYFIDYLRQKDYNKPETRLPRNKENFIAYILDGFIILLICISSAVIVTYANKREMDRLRDQIKGIDHMEKKVIGPLLDKIGILDSKLYGKNAIFTRIDNENRSTITGFTIKQYNDIIKEIPGTLAELVREYKKIEDKTYTSRMSKMKQITVLTKYFDTLSDMVNLDSDKYSGIPSNAPIIIQCLLNIILVDDACHKLEDSGISAILSSCPSGMCGMTGLLQRQRVNSGGTFLNGMENITIADKDTFFKIIRTEVLDMNSGPELDKLPLFVIVKNLFVTKIKIYDIKLEQFMMVLDSYFRDFDVSSNKSIEISKSEYINNYKLIIRYIYKNFQLTNIVNNILTAEKIDNYKLSRFNDIIKYHSAAQLKTFSDELDSTISKIVNFNTIFKDDLMTELNDDVLYTKILYIVVIVISFLSGLFFIRYALSNSKPSDTARTGELIKLDSYYIQLSAMGSIILWINVVMWAAYYKRSVTVQIKRRNFGDDNKVFTKKLEELKGAIDSAILAKSALDYSKNKKQLDPLLRKFNIRAAEVKSDNGGTTVAYSLYNSATDYTIIDADDVQSIVNQRLYIRMLETISLYKCCSFLSKGAKTPIFPWADISVSIITLAIIVVAALFLVKVLGITDMLSNGLDKLRGTSTAVQMGGATNANDRQIGIMIAITIGFMILTVYSARSSYSYISDITSLGNSY